MPESELPYVNTLARQLFEGIVTVLGESGLQATLIRAGLAQWRAEPPPNDLGDAITMREYARLMQALETVTGRAHGKTMRRIGRAGFIWSQQHPPSLDPFASIALKTLPREMRKLRVLRAIAAGMQEMVPSGKTQVSRGDGVLIYDDYQSAAAYERTSDQPVCGVYAGYLQQAMTFATGREAEAFKVTERTCKANGADCCRFEIEEQYI